MNKYIKVLLRISEGQNIEDGDVYKDIEDITKNYLESGMKSKALRKCIQNKGYLFKVANALPKLVSQHERLASLNRVDEEGNSHEQSFLRKNLWYD